MKKLSRILILSALLINQLVMPLNVWAQDVTPTDSPAPVPTDSSTPPPSPTDAPTPQPTDTPTTTITAPTPTPTIGAPQQTVVVVVTADTPTPDGPTPTTDPNATPTPIPTIISVSPLSPSDTPTPDSGNNNNSNNSSGGNNNPSTNIQNTATVNNTSQSNADTGSNTIDNSGKGSSTITTGEATAYANLINLLNTNSVGSHVQIYLMNNLTGQMQDIDLNTAWNLLVNGSSSTSLVTVDATNPNDLVAIGNYGLVQNQVTVTAGSGSNTISGGGNNGIYTGDAYALANVINLLNSNLIGANVFLGVVNVNGATLGNLILPNPEDFQVTGGSSNVNADISNTAGISTDAQTTALTGNNDIGTSGRGDNTIGTGSATAITNVLTMTNLNAVNAGEMILGLNALGDWTGSILNWNGPGSVTPGSNVNLFITSLQPQGDSSNGGLTVGINNQAYIYNQILVQAMTGGNQISTTRGASTIQTGNAFAVANVDNLANLNIIGGNWFYGIINVIGNWSGNIVFAYPDLTVGMGLSTNQVNVGDEFEATVNYGNTGLDSNNQETVTMNLPPGVEYVSDNSGVTPTISGNSVSWDLNNLVIPNSSMSFTVTLKITNGITAMAKSGWFRIAAPVMADNNSKTVVIVTSISSNRTELSNNNKTASAALNVNLDSPGSSSGDPAGYTPAPNLSISVDNNVKDFVYPGDVVSFDVEAKNQGDAAAYNTYIDHKIYDENGNLLNENKINIGNVGNGKSGKVTFGVPIKVNISHNEMLKSETTWIGTKENGDGVSSNTAGTTFEVKYRGVNIPGPETVQAVNLNSGVLGATTANFGRGVLDILPYLLLFILSIVWLMENLKKTETKSKKNVMKLGGKILLMVFVLGCFAYSGMWLLHHAVDVLTWVKSMKV